MVLGTSGLRACGEGECTNEMSVHGKSKAEGKRVEETVYRVPLYIIGHCNLEHRPHGIRNFQSQEAFDTTNRFQCLLCGPMQERQSGDKDHKPNPVVQSSRDARR